MKSLGSGRCSKRKQVRKSKPLSEPQVLNLSNRCARRSRTNKAMLPLRNQVLDAPQLTIAAPCGARHMGARTLVAETGRS